ncbi:hypothetical protein [Marinilabilia sp.]|uniref:hypothetical protein n=1 Tax=Marinilabilia sp. TaxID=2021252 RepID=UPI0025BA0A90|nr:hypothetical protein [Marinilabilia sp.]
MKFIFKTISLLSIALLMLNGCEQVDDTITDIQKTAALRNVDFTYDSLSTELVLPEGSLSGKTFQEMYENNKELFSDASNYSVKINTHYTADNTKEDAVDAMFSGMMQDIILNNIAESPVRFETSAFEVAKNDVLDISSSSVIGLETHRLTVMYIFRQIIAEEDLDAKISSKLNYELGVEKGNINLGEIQRYIPTKASDETKAFVSGLLESGLFDE